MTTDVAAGSIVIALQPGGHSILRLRKYEPDSRMWCSAAGPRATVSMSMRESHVRFASVTACAEALVASASSAVETVVNVESPRRASEKAMGGQPERDTGGWSALATR